MVTVTCAGTGWPFRVAGSYRYCFKVSTAESRKEGGPEITFMEVISPAVPTTASITTLPLSKSRKASSEATAFTELINFGGTMTPSTSEGSGDSEAAFAAGATFERFAASVVDGDAFLTTGWPSDSPDAWDCVDESVA
jgi:hypothetical protein